MERVLHVLAVTVFAGSLILTLLLDYYAYVAITSGSGNWLTDLVGVLLARQQSFMGLFGALIVGIPGFALNLATENKNSITSRGKLYLCLLVPTLAFASACSIALVPDQVDLGTAGTPQLVDSAANYFASYCVTLISAIFGLGKLGSTISGRT